MKFLSANAFLTMSLASISISYNQVAVLALGISSNGPSMREIEFTNDSGAGIEVYEVINPATTRELVLIKKGDAYDNVTIRHDMSEVEIHEVCNNSNNEKHDEEMTCRRVVLEISHAEGKQVYTINKDFQLEQALTETQKESIEVVNGIIQGCRGGGDADATCVLKGFANYVTRAREDLAFETAMRQKVADTLEHYSCNDSSLSSSEPIRHSSWEDPIQKDSYQVQIMHEHSSSQIHLIENFIGQEECKAILAVADESNLSRASLAGSMMNLKFRKVMQTTVVVPWDKEEEGHPIARVTRRIYDYTNDALPGLNISEEGQSDLKYLHYTGRGRNDTEPDHYTAHADANCDGSKHQRGQRVATMVMYCETAEDGGHTNFQNVGVHIAAKPGDALFFSYIDPLTLTMDNGYTVHSGCPVYEGHKKVVTQWIRLGVDTDTPFHALKGVY